MPTSKAVNVNVLPFVTDWLADSAPVASRRLLLVSTKAQCEAVPVADTVPSVMALTVTLRPLGLRSVGALTVGEVLLPSV